MTQEIFKIYSNDIITVLGADRNRMYNVYKSVKGIKSIKKMSVRQRGMKCMLVDYAVWKAIDLFKTSNGYGGLSLQDYLRKVFPDSS